jgi:hypothetical protein
VAAGIALTLPCFSFRWIWDDFDFIARAQSLRFSHLLPDPATVYYRPLSREIYFALVWFLGGGSPLAGHVLNAVLLGIATLLVVSLGTHLSGRRAGATAGLLFATLGAASFLVAWVSGAQDLLSICFVLLALRLQADGRSLPAVAAFACAVLSKETALTAIPVLIALPWILGSPPRRPLLHVLPYLVGGLAWLAVHPGIRILLSRDFSVGTGGYVGFGNPGRLEFLGRMLLTLVNLPATRISTPWPEGREYAAVVACALAAGAAWVAGRRGGAPSARGPALAPGRVVLLGALLAIGPVLLASSVLRYWSAYYSVFPAIGTSLVGGVGLARLPRAAAAATVVVFTLAGVWSRWSAHDPYAPCERYYETCSRALERVEAGFKSLRATLPRGATVLASVGSTGALGIHHHVHRFQALKAWYRDPTLVTLPPEQRRDTQGAEFLFRVTPELDVVEIDTERALHRSSGMTPAPQEVQRPARTYARALARAGETDRAVRIQTTLAARDIGPIRSYDLRLAAMFLLGAGRDPEADSILTVAQPFSRELSLDFIAKIYMEATSDDGPHRFAFRAFGIDPADVDASRYVMRRLHREGYLHSAAVVARNLLARLSRDAECDSVIAAASRAQRPDHLTSEVSPGRP